MSILLSSQKSGKLLFTLVIVIFLAGCTSQSSQSQTGNGISIISFNPDLDKITSGSKVSLNLLIENTGESEANDISAELVGLDGWSIESSRTQTTENLFAADPINNFKGGTTSFTWVAVSPSNDFEQPYSVSSKVYYTYETRASVQLKIDNYELYYKTLPEAEQKTEKLGVVSQTSSLGPFKVTATSQARFSQDGNVPVEIDIQNTGGGKAFKIGDRPIATTIDIISADVDGVDSCKNLPPNDLQVKLSAGSSAKLKCNLSISDVSTVKIFPIEIKLKYRYITEKPSSITVSRTIQ